MQLFYLPAATSAVTLKHCTASNKDAMFGDNFRNPCNLKIIQSYYTNQLGKKHATKVHHLGTGTRTETILLQYWYTVRYGTLQHTEY